MEFIGREEELAFLESQYKMEHPLTFVVGRRRVGKSALILRFLEGKDALYFETDRETKGMILRSFSRTVSETLDNPSCEFGSWKDAIEAFVTLSPSGRKVIAIDEFQYISMTDENFPKEFQGIWDNYLSKQDVMVIVCGSYLTMMRRLCMDYNAPLYGRNTGNLRLMPLRFHKTIKNKDYRRSVEEYAVTGGVPYYMNMMDGDLSVTENVERLTMDLGAPLLNEPAYLISDEFRDPASYNTYLRVIASGSRKLDRITSAVQLPSTAIMPYLKRLMNVGMLERRTPITDGPETHSRKSMYIISDDFIALWFRFVYPYHNNILRQDSDAARSNLRRHFIDSHVSFVFEDICRSELRRYLRSKGVAASYGSFWEGDVEIDVAAKDDVNRVMYLGECKYREGPVDSDVLGSLRTKGLRAKAFDGYDIVYCLFSVSGYTDRLKAEAKSGGCILFDCGEPL